MGDASRAQSVPLPKGIPYGSNGNGSAGRRTDVAPYLNLPSVNVARDVEPFAPEVVRIFTAALPASVGKALARLAKDAPNDYVTPCRESPAEFDAPPIAQVNTKRFKSQVAAVAVACDKCLDCLLFVQCLAVAESNANEPRPVITGILAGRLYGDEPGTIAAREALGQERNYLSA